MQSSFNTASDRSLPLMRWSAIAAGASVALAIMATLYAFGVSAGLAAFDFDIPGRAKHAGIFIGAFGVVVPFVALALGGYVAGRCANASSKSVGFLHGLTMWSVSALALLWVTYASVSAATQGVVTVGKQAAQVGTSVLQAGGSALSEGMDELQKTAKNAAHEAQERINIDPETALQAVNAKLREHGKKPISPEQLKRTLKVLTDKAMHNRTLDRAMVIDAVTQENNISREDAEAVADDLTHRFEEAKQEAQKRVDEAKAGLNEARQMATQELEKAAQQAAEAASKAFGALFMALALGLVAAGGGGVLAAQKQS